MSEQDSRTQHSRRDLIRAEIDVPPTPPDPNRPLPIPKMPPAPPTPTDEPPPEPVVDPPSEYEPKPPYTVEHRTVMRRRWRRWDVVSETTAFAVSGVNLDRSGGP